MKQRFLTERETGFSLIELIIVFVILAILAPIAITASTSIRESEVGRRWSKTLVETLKPLKSAINDCLKESQGNIGTCNELGANKLGKYGISDLPAANDNFLAVSLLTENAGIKIVGKKCIVEIMPSRINHANLWKIAVSTPANSEFSLTACKCAIYNKYLLESYEAIEPVENCASIWRFLFD